MEVCTFNGLALAANAGLEAGAGDVLILDLDAHCGGGTYELVVDNSHTWHLDVSVNSFDGYRPKDRNYLEIVDDSSDYLPAIQRSLEKLGGFRFGLCIYNAGMDPHEDCPIGNLPGINDSILQKREEMVFSWCRENRLPIAFVMAGGYILQPRMNESRLVNLHRYTLEAAARYQD
jgi:acetoin utilization deacetylase AcuC-like enzyme